MPVRYFDGRRISARASHVIHFCGLRTWEEVAALTDEQLLAALPSSANIGRGTMDELRGRTPVDSEIIRLKKTIKNLEEKLKLARAKLLTLTQSDDGQPSGDASNIDSA